MTIYGRRTGTPYDWANLQSRRKQLIWSRSWDHARAGLGDAFNTDPDTANFPNVLRRIDADQGCLTCRAGNLQNIGNPGFGSPWPRGTSFVIPEWLQDGSPDQVPQYLPNLPGVLETNRAIVIYARLRMRATDGQATSFNPFVDVMPTADFFIGPEAFVGDQATPAPFMLQSIWPDFSLNTDSPDTPPNTWSTSATPPIAFSDEAFWQSRPGAFTQEQWQDAAPSQTNAYWNPLAGNSLFLRTFVLADSKTPGIFQTICWMSRNGTDWTFSGDRAYANTIDPNATAVRRVGLSVRGLAYAALDFIHVYYCQALDVQTIQDLTDLEPWFIEDSMPPPGGRFFDTLT